MRLEQILIHGFKSFAEKTDLRILSGITCIVGPNGCGKSNVADAVRWALGEQSPRLLRGHKMEDVIFHGSQSRRSLGMAEVDLRFANDGRLALPWGEVSVARRLYRSGDSEYLLNGNHCRLRDVQDLIAGTGVNPKAYALMDQERLNYVLTAKPWERRIFIEEAAGVARYKQQRAETQGKLEATRQNLQRVRDIMDEVRRQLGSLERQARKAQQYKALYQERQALALALLAADWAALTERQEDLSREAAAVRDQDQELRTALAGMAALEAGQRASLQQLEYRLGDLRQAVQKMQVEAERLLERREQIGHQLRDADAEEARLEEEIRAVGARLEEIAREAVDKRVACGDARQRHAQGEGRAGDLEATLEVLRSALRSARERLEAFRLEQVALAGRRNELTRAAGELRGRQAQLHRARERVEAEAVAAGAELAAVVARRDALERRRQQTGVQLSLLETERQEAAVLLAEREAALAQTRSALGELSVAEASRHAAQESLERLEREREGYGAGVRAVFSAAGQPDLAGVVGTVADLLDVPPDLEAAVEAVLGDRLQWVVVERFEHARAAVGYLHSCGAGAATFLPLDTLPARGDAPHGAGELPPPVRWAAGLVGGPEARLLRYLLGRVGVVDDLDEAERLWRRNGVVATYVTPAGDVLAATGRLSGGRRNGEQHGDDHSILRRKRAIRQLGDELRQIRGNLAAERARAGELEREITILQGRRATLSSSVQAQEAAHLAGQKDLEAAVREEERLRRHRETLGVESDQLAAEADETTRRLEQTDAALAESREGEAALDAEMGAVRLAAESDERQEAQVSTEVTACRVELAALAERAESLERALAQLTDLEAEGRRRLDQAHARRQQIAGRKAELAIDQERSDVQARQAVADRDRLDEELRRLGEEHRRQVEVRDAADAERRAREQVLSGLLARQHAIDLQATEIRVRAEELVQEGRRAHGVGGPEALAAAHDSGRDLVAARSRHQELGVKIEGLGQVNLIADEEYRELEERLGFLRAQHDDLVGSMKDLERALRGMTRTAQERFQEAFAEINRHFADIFGRLFEGGRAELRMVEPEEGDDDPLDWGVELMAQPRGKRLQSVTLMSGGEKALTGLALLFAIFYYRPSPFCVLDEVDAPLDDANIHRFLRVLRELCSRTQFVVISHNRHTMEAADILYGITMEEPGLSRLVSVKLADVALAEP
jgi:chromosome segregation protein